MTAPDSSPEARLVTREQLAAALPSEGALPIRPWEREALAQYIFDRLPAAPASDPIDLAEWNVAWQSPKCDGCAECDLECICHPATGIHGTPPAAAPAEGHPATAFHEDHLWVASDDCAVCGGTPDCHPAALARHESEGE